ncbi:MAG: hypothetical protein J6D52_09490 [Clostridia bacterium]|nr:hypothetical protein [Clostridia bacterium]
MLEKMFTTKMSADKKKLQSRFSKIRSKNGKLSKVIGGILFGIIIAAIICVGVMIAVNDTKDYRMTDEEFSDYIHRPIGAIMADIDYVDDEKLVFHYLEGFFVMDQQSYEILHKINLSKLNIAGHTQGDCYTVFKIDKDGRFAYLTNEGINDDRVAKYDNYIIDLKTGEVKIGNAPNGTDFFTNYADTSSTVKDTYGWYSSRCINIGEDRTFYLTTQDSIIAALQLVVDIHMKDYENVGMRYVFGNDYVSAAQLKQNIIHNALEDDEEILINSGFHWEVNDDKVKSIINKLSETRNMKYIDIKDGNYDVRIYDIWNNATEENNPMIFIIDNYKFELVFSMSIRMDEQKFFVNLLSNPESQQSNLYTKTKEFLEKEFRRVYTQYYDIQNLTISDWQENGNEATFFYKMTFLNYNRDPDKAEYIQEAKKRSQKEYETLYKDYLALKEANYEFKVVLNGGEIELYSNVSPKGTEWAPIKIDDYVVGE